MIGDILNELTFHSADNNNKPNEFRKGWNIKSSLVFIMNFAV